MMPRLTISLESEEYEALQRMAEEEYRPPKDQLRWLLRREAVHRGLLSGDSGAQRQTDALGHQCSKETVEYGKNLQSSGLRDNRSLSR